MNINERAAKWWGQLWKDEATRPQFEAALLSRLPDGDWETYNDYDPWDILLEAVRAVRPCRGEWFSGEALGFPTKTGLQRIGNKLVAKKGYGAPWIEVTA